MSCINTETREALIMEIDDLLPDSNRKVKLANFVNELPVCATDDIQKGKRKQRPLSKYNVFMSKCLKEKDMKSCVKEYHIIKKEL